MAIRIEFLAWHSPVPLSHDDIMRRLEAVEGFYPHAFHDSFAKIGAAGHTGLIIWSPRVKGLAQLAGFEGEALAYASHLPFGISAHTNLSGRCTPAGVLALHEKVRSKPETVTTLSAPLNLVHLAADGGLHIHNDYRGFAEVFHFAGKDGLKVWSSRLSMPLLFALQAPVESAAGAQTRAVFSYYPHSHTPFANVARLEGGTAVFAGDWPADPLIVQRKLLLTMLAEASAQQGVPIDYARCGESVKKMLSEMELFWSGPRRSGLTGGRDSRAVLAFLIAAGIASKVPLVTTKILKQDYEVAANLVALCQREGQPVTWALAERPPSSYAASNRDQAWADFPVAREHGPSFKAATISWLSRLRGGPRPEPADGYVYQDNPLLDRMVFQFHRLDGQTMPIGYYASPARERADVAGTLTLGGHSGEILRASQYTEDSLALGPEEWRRKRERALFRTGQAWVGRRDRKAPYTVDAHKRARQAWRQYFDDAEATGLKGFHVFDYINVAGKQSRRVDVPKQLCLVCPLSHPELLAESYKLSPAARLGNEFPMSLIKATAPYLLETPFSFQLPKETADLRLDMTGKPQFWDKEALPGFAEIIKDKARWEDTFDEGCIAAEFGANAMPELNAYQRDTMAGLLLWRAAHQAYAKVLRTYIARRRKDLAVAA